MSAYATFGIIKVEAKLAAFHKVRPLNEWYVPRWDMSLVVVLTHMFQFTENCKALRKNRSQCNRIFSARPEVIYNLRTIRVLF